MGKGGLYAFCTEKDDVQANKNPCGGNRQGLGRAEIC